MATGTQSWEGDEVSKSSEPATTAWGAAAEAAGTAATAENEESVSSE